MELEPPLGGPDRVGPVEEPDADDRCRPVKVIERMLGCASKDGRFQQPKTWTSVRAIDASPTLVAALREHRMASRFKDVEDLVFPSEKGAPLEAGTPSAGTSRRRCGARSCRRCGSMISATRSRAC
jgi:hypothetical protein